jgi:Protein of unknown function (DUF2959)
MTRPPVLGLLPLLAGLPAYSSLYHGALEQVGIQKRHILADRIEDGREAQEQFQDAFERFETATRFEGGELLEQG